MTTTTKLRFNLSATLKRKYKLEELFADLQGFAYEAERFTAFVRKIHSVIPRADLDSLQRSLQYLVGVEFIGQVTEDLAWLLAANIDKLSRCEIVPPFTQPIFREWVMFQVLSVRKFKVLTTIDKSKPKILKNVAEFSLVALSGHPAGHKTTKFMPEGRLYSKAVRPVVGFSKYEQSSNARPDSRRRFYPLRDLNEYTRLRFVGLVEPTECNYGLDFTKLVCPAGCLKWNKGLLKKRAREGYECPMNYNVIKRPCYLCEVGYDNCSAGCHPLTYTVGPCSNCGNPEQYFDPINPTGMCVDCSCKLISES